MGLKSKLISSNVVLLFHTVPSQKWFRATLETVGQMFHFVSLADLDSYFQRGRTLKGSCHVCFDDGDRAFMDVAFPVLKELGIPSSLYVSPRIVQEEGNYWFQEVDGLVEQGAAGHVRAATARVLGLEPDSIGKFGLSVLFKCMSLEKIREVLATVRSATSLEVTRRYNVTRAELLQIRDSGLVAIGAHTQDHPILALESDQESRAQIVDSVRDLSDLLSQPVWSFAYPNGDSKLDFGDREKRTLMECGVRLAFSTDTSFFHQHSDPLGIPRGGFDGTDRETRAWIVTKLVLTPFWNPVREFLKRASEPKQRSEIQLLLSRKLP
jgi:peptidoglycan/xylan/chitin deacetylase (PgdA/CDA1 family)